MTMLAQLAAVLALTVPHGPFSAAPDSLAADLHRAAVIRARERSRARRRAHHLAVLRAIASRPFRAVSAAMGQMGVPYVWGGESPGSGFDCSGLVQWAYSRVGVWLPRTTWGMMLVGRPVSMSALHVGDLVFAEGGGHVGLYAGRGLVLNAPYTGAVVSLAPLSWGWEFARRVTG